MNQFLAAFVLLTDAASSNTAGDVSATNNFLSLLMTIGPIALLLLAMWFFLIRPQKKQEKENNKMRSNIEVGDKVTTIGGITGTVRQIKDDDVLVIETGADKSKVSIKRWAVQSKDTISDN